MWNTNGKNMTFFRLFWDVLIRFRRNFSAQEVIWFLLKSSLTLTLTSNHLVMRRHSLVHSYRVKEPSNSRYDNTFTN